MRAWLLSLVLCLSLFAVPASAQSGTGTLHGTVCLDDQALNGTMQRMPAGECWSETVPFASVYATPEGGARLSTQADEDGFFIFPGLAPGTYQVEAAVEGFTVHAQEEDLVAGQRTYLVLLAEPTLVDVTGRLVDEQKEPVPGVLLRLDGRGRLWSVTTDAQGAFAGQVHAGWHHTWMDIPGFQRGSATIFIDGSKPVNLMVLHFEGSVLLQGKVIDQHGSPVPDASIEGRLERNAWSKDAWQDGPEYRNGYQVAADPWEAGTFRAVTDSEGHFAVRANPGPTQINVWAEDHQGHHQAIQVPNATTAHVELLMHRLPARDAHVAGTVLDAESGQPVQNFRVEIDNRLYGHWFCSTDQPEAGSCPVFARDGAFAGDVMPGYSIMRVWAWEFCDDHCRREPYIAHVQTVVLEPGQNTFAIELQPRPKANAIISGYILDDAGKPVDARLNFYNEEAFGHGGTNTDQYGSYRVQLVAGLQRVSVWAPGFYPWEGMIKAIAGKEASLDVRLVEDPNDCCSPPGGYHDEPMRGSPPMSTGSVRVGDRTHEESLMEANGTSSDEHFADLGGLGQEYDSAQRSEARDEVSSREKSRGVPAWGIFGIAGILAAVVLRRR